MFSDSTKDSWGKPVAHVNDREIRHQTQNSSTQVFL
jgi:hypothetical protein